jgi:hypothetical protein
LHEYEVRPRRDKRGADLISDVLPFDRLWYIEPNAISNAIAYAKFRSPVTHAAIRAYDDAGNVIETHEHAGHLPHSRLRLPRGRATDRLDDLPDCANHELGLLHLDGMAAVCVADVFRVEKLCETILSGSPRRPRLRSSGAKVESLVRTACGAVGR